jgi:single-strand DNA-binding protein
MPSPATPSSKVTAHPTADATSHRVSSKRSSAAVGPPPARSNLVILRGVVTADGVDRQLPSGSVAMQFDVRTTAHGDLPASAVNVSLVDPAADARAAVQRDEHVVVIGTVQRRFFRVGGATQSRTEVVADLVVPARRTRAVRSAIAAAARSLGD